MLTIALNFTGYAQAYDMSKQAISQRIAPVGSVYLQGEAPALETTAKPSGPRTGKMIYNTYCVACHATGIAGAPKVGDTAQWNLRLAKGRNILNDHAIKGFNAMPARGTCMDCSDEEIIKTIDYMLSL